MNTIILILTLRLSVICSGVVYYIYSTVGSSIADIFNPRRHIYQGAKHRDKYAAKAIYRGYGPTYRIIYTIYYGECATDEPLPKNASRNDDIFAQKVYWIYATTSQYLSSYGCAITMVYFYIATISICFERVFLGVYSSPVSNIFVRHLVFIIYDCLDANL